MLVSCQLLVVGCWLLVVRNSNIASCICTNPQSAIVNRKSFSMVALRVTIVKRKHKLLLRSGSAEETIVEVEADWKVLA